MKRIHLIISGLVQGVGYRAWFRKNARNLGVTGWVKNREDDTVEAVCEGDSDTLQILINIVKQGPETAKIDDVFIDWDLATHEFSDFTITL